MARQSSGGLGLVIAIALASVAACNLSDPVSFTPAECASDSDCPNGQCVERSGELVCECDEFFTGADCDACVEDRTLNDDGECVEEDVVAPDMGMMDEPCLAVTPDPLDFGQIELGRAAVLTATISNCSQTFDLSVDDVSVCLESGADCMTTEIFQLDSVDPELPAALAPGASASARVRFLPEVGEATGRLDVSAGELSGSIALSGEGIGDDCVEITAEARTMSEPMWTDQATVGPYQTVELRTLVTAGPAGAIQSHEWSIVSQPMGASTRLLPDSMSAMPMFFADSPGEYVIEVTTLDADNQPPCAPARVTVTTEIGADLFVDLVWETPNDPDPMDNDGADVDLHVMHPNGTWGAPPWDVFADNPTPDWGVRGDSSDDPRLVRSDDDGLGPEFVVLGAAEDVTYRVGAYGRNPNGFGPSDVTLRLFLSGALVYTGRATIARDEFWFAGGIDWAAQSFSEVNQITMGFP